MKHRQRTKLERSLADQEQAARAAENELRAALGMQENNNGEQDTKLDGQIGIQLGIDAKSRMIVVVFPYLMRQLNFTPDMALKFGNDIVEKAKKLQGQAPPDGH